MLFCTEQVLKPIPNNASKLKIGVLSVNFLCLSICLCVCVSMCVHVCPCVRSLYSGLGYCKTCSNPIKSMKLGMLVGIGHRKKIRVVAKMIYD